MVRGRKPLAAATGDPDEEQEKEPTKRSAPVKRKHPEPNGAMAFEDFSAKSFRRSAPGKQAIKLFVKNLARLDDLAFPEQPCFDLEGKCNLALDGASKFTWNHISEAAPDVLDSLFLGLCALGFS